MRLMGLEKAICMRAMQQSICNVRACPQSARTLFITLLLHIIEIALSLWICEQDIVVAKSMPLCHLKTGLPVSSRAFLSRHSFVRV